MTETPRFPDPDGAHRHGNAPEAPAALWGPAPRAPDVAGRRQLRGLALARVTELGHIVDRMPLVAAETYSLIDVLLFGMTVWRLKSRTPPAPAPADATVDVFITTYNEPLELVMTTALAAQKIRHPHSTWILTMVTGPRSGNWPRRADWGT